MAKGPGGFSVGRVSIQVVPDTSEFRKELQAKLKKAIKGIKVEIPVDVDAKKAITKLKALDKVVRRMNGRQINIGAKLSSSGDVDKLSKDLSKVGKSATQAAEGFGSIGRTGAIALAVLVLIAPALALVATLLAGLPSLLFAFGFAALTVGLGLDGLKKAASGFAPTIDKLKASLSKTFADQLTKPFIELNKIAPVLNKGLNAIAVSLSGIIKDMIGFATSTKGMKELETILTNTAKFFEFLRPAILDGVRAFTLLGATASTEFQGLAATFNRFSKNFLDIVETATDTGVLTSALRNLNLVLDSLLDAFNQFFKAGLEAMTILGGPITILFSGFTDAIVALMPILTEISRLVFEVFGEAFKQLAPIVTALTPSLKLLGKLLGDLLVGALRIVGPLLVQVAEILNNVLVRALVTLAPFIPKLLDFFGQLGVLIGQFLVVAFQALSPLLTVFLKFVTDLFTALTPLMPLLLELATVALRTLADILIELSPELVHLAQEAFPQLVKIVTDLVPIIRDVINIIIEILPYIADFASFLLDILIPAMSALIQATSDIWPRIRQTIQSGLDLIKGLFDIFMGIITLDWSRLWRGIKETASNGMGLLKNAILLGLQLVLETFIALPSRIFSAIAGLPQGLFSSGRAMIQAFIDGAVSLATTAVNKVKAILNSVSGLFPHSPAKFGPFSGKGYTLYSGRALIEDWAKGITEGTPEAVRAISQAMDASQGALDMQAVVASEGYGSVADKIAEALAQWGIEIDANGLARMVNKVNNMNARR